MNSPGRHTRLERLLSLVTHLRPGEGQAALLFFLHGFLLLSSYQMVKALREAFMLARFSAEARSYAVAIMALVLMLVVPLYGWVRRRLDGAQLLRVVTIFFVVSMPAFAVLAHFKVPIAIAFFVWVGIYGVMVVSQMWSFAADSFNVKTGQRLFVLIMLGANMGALAGAKITQLAVASLSPIGLMILASGFLGSTLLLATRERAAVPLGSRALPADQQLPAPRIFGGLGLVMRDRYLFMIAVFVVLLNWINSTGEFILADYVKSHAEASVASGGSRDEGAFIAAFYGNFYFWVTLIGLGIQLLLVSWIFRTVGVRGALLIHPVIVAVGYLALAVAPLLGGVIPIFSLIRRIKVADNGVDYSLMNTTRQTLFLPVDRHAKYEGKMAIDTFFWRFGDLIQAVGIYIGIHLLSWQGHQFAVLNFVLALIWIAVANLMGRQYSHQSLASMTNMSPVAVDPIPDLRVIPGQPFRHLIPPTAFDDPDPGDVLRLGACCANGRPLPRWMRFDVWQGAFVGKAPLNIEHDALRITVTASDLDGLRASSTFTVWRAASERIA